MFCSRSLNDHVSTFQDILEITKEKTIHQDNLECLAKVVYKFLNDLSPPIMNGAFMIRNNIYNLRNFQYLYSKKRRSVKYGIETVTYRGPQIWNLVPEIPRVVDFDYCTCC